MLDDLTALYKRHANPRTVLVGHSYGTSMALRLSAAAAAEGSGLYAPAGTRLCLAPLRRLAKFIRIVCGGMGCSGAPWWCDGDAAASELGSLRRYFARH